MSFAALGAVCTVLDYSDKQLESEAMVAEREGYSIEIIKADMTKNMKGRVESPTARRIPAPIL